MPYNANDSSLRYLRRKKRSKKTFRKKRVVLKIRRKRNYNVSIQRGIGMGNSAWARFKLNVPTFSINVPAALPGGTSLSILGNSIAPYQNTTSELVGSIQIPVGQWLYQNLQQYAPYYRRYYVNWCKMTVRATLLPNAAGSPFTTQPVQLFVGAYQYNGEGSETALTPAVLDTYSTVELQNQKGIKFRTLAPLGNQSQKSITMIRSTRKLMGVKDLQDNKNFSGGLDRDFFTYNNPTNPVGLTSPQRQWFYYIKLQNPAEQTVSPVVSLSFQLEASIMFNQRIVWILPQSVTPGPGPGPV